MLWISTSNCTEREKRHFFLMLTFFNLFITKKSARVRVYTRMHAHARVRARTFIEKMVFRKNGTGLRPPIDLRRTIRAGRGMHPVLLNNFALHQATAPTTTSETQNPNDSSKTSARHGHCQSSWPERTSCGYEPVDHRQATASATQNPNAVRIATGVPAAIRWSGRKPAAPGLPAGRAAPGGWSGPARRPPAPAR